MMKARATPPRQPPEGKPRESPSRHARARAGDRAPWADSRPRREAPDIAARAAACSRAAFEPFFNSSALILAWSNWWDRKEETKQTEEHSKAR